MNAYEVTPEQAPELHGMIDRLCAMADMPNPRVAISETRIPNAFATGRSPERAVVCVTTGILQTLTTEELWRRIDAAFDGLGREERAVPRSVTGTLGDGAASLTVNSVSGAITLLSRPDPEALKREGDHDR